MAQYSPKIAASALSGEAGVNLVATVVSDDLKWLFRRNHGESDFGIDGYIDIVEPDGTVTGRCLAIQVKSGSSYFRTKTEYGYTYYGELRHLNYLLNHPIPVLIVICDPASRVCYWEHFSPERTEPTESGWKLCIPFEQTLGRAVLEQLKAIAGPAVDYAGKLQAYWAFNQLVSEVDFILYPVDRSEIEAQYRTNAVAFFARLLVTKSLAKSLQGRVELSVSGFEGDRRELWQIPSVVRWFALVEPLVKGWFFFLRTNGGAHGLSTLAFCRCKARWIGRRWRPVGQSGQVQLDKELFGEFILRNYNDLNEITDWLAMSDEENAKISQAVARCFGLPTTFP